MWILTLVGCVVEPNPAAFDWRIDRTRVAGIQVWPAEGDHTVPRRIDALVLSPHVVREVRAEVCGLRTDLPVHLAYDGTCFAERALRTPIPGALPTLWEPPVLTFDCPHTEYAEGDVEPEGIADSGLSFTPGCASMVPIGVHATTDVDQATSAVFVTLSVEAWDPRPLLPDPAEAAPTLEVVEGVPSAGGQVVLRFSALEGSPESVQWYAAAGILYGTGRTGLLGVEDGRQFAENRLEIPSRFHGPLQVAAVAGGTVWAVTELVVP